jgi:O-antigen ligase
LAALRLINLYKIFSNINIQKIIICCYSFSISSIFYLDDPILTINIMYASILLSALSIIAHYKRSFYLYHVIHHINSNFLLLLLYSFLIIFSTLVSAKFNFLSEFYIYYFFIPTLVFIVYTYLACVFYGVSIYCILRILSLAASTSCFINLFLFYSNHNFTDRFMPIHGLAFGYWPTLAGLSIIEFATISIYFAISSDERIDIPQSVSSFVLLIAVSATQTRSCLLSLVITVFLLILIKYRFNKRNINLMSNICPIYFFGLLIALYYVFIYMEGFYRFDNHRLEVWQKFWTIIIDRPIFGYGQRIGFALTISDGEKIEHAHNILLSSMLRTGFVGSILLIVFLLKVTYLGIRNVWLNGQYLFFLLFVQVIIAGIFDFEVLLSPSGWSWIAIWLPLTLVTIRNDNHADHQTFKFILGPSLHS